MRGPCASRGEGNTLLRRCAAIPPLSRYALRAGGRSLRCGAALARLHRLISDHARYANSKRAAEILADWKRYRPMFKKVMPVEYRRALADMAKEKAATMQAAE